jgi:purine nucleoside permease
MEPYRIPFPRCRALLAAVSMMALPAARSGASPIPIPVMVIATYETGKDRGDTPGELQYWVERQNLDQEIKVPGVDHPIMTNGNGLYAMVSGTSSRCAVQIMALAADPRFDLTHTYFMLSGIGGGDLNVVSLASAVWVQQVVDGNPAFEIDSREIPASWPYGLVAIGATEPGVGSANVDSVPAAGASEDGSGGIGTVAFKLNPSLVKWAYELTKDVPIPSNDSMRAFCSKYEGYPNAGKPPIVIMADSMGVDRFWFGDVMTRWAEDWVRIYTRGKGTYAICDCEDAGMCLAFQRLAQMGKVDFKRLLILRTASNFSVPTKGVSATDGLFKETISDSGGTGYLPALEADYRVGSVVALALLKDKDKYHDATP